MKMMIIPVVIGALGTIPKGLVKGLEDLKIRGQVKTILTTALLRLVRILIKTPGDLRRLAVTQTLVKNHQLMVVWKTLKG